MPQSLPQLEITALSYGKGPRESISPPTQDEQETMANLWAMEEVNSPPGWENEQEIDYAELASKRMATESRTTDGNRDSGVHMQAGDFWLGGKSAKQGGLGRGLGASLLPSRQKIYMVISLGGKGESQFPPV